MNNNKIIYLIFLIFSCFGTLYAQSSEEELNTKLKASSAVLMDYQTGRILFEREGNIPRPPASMAKVMTLFLTYDAIRKGELRKDDIITIDEQGSSFSRPPFSSLMLLEEGQRVSVLDLMKGVAVDSGNDAAYALADILGPGKDAFVNKMNAKARDLNLHNARFVDPDGWSEFNMISPREYAVLARSYIQEYPEALKELHSVPFLVYPLPENLPEGEDFKIKVPRRKRNTNILLGRYDGIDGLKTGYIDESGFNFTGTASRNGWRLIAVIMGVHTDSYYQGIRERAFETKNLLDYGYSHFSPLFLSSPEFPKVRIWYSHQKYLTPVVDKTPEVLLADDELSGIYNRIQLDQNISAPMNKGSVIGRVDYFLGETLLGSSDILIPEAVLKGNLFDRIRDSLILLWHQVRE